MHTHKIRLLALLSAIAMPFLAASTALAQGQSVARQWNELLLESIRNDYARPTVHARNLYHVSMAMWDAWAAFSPTAQPILFEERYILDFPEPAREEAISYASYRMLNWRFQNSPAYAEMRPQYDALMVSLGYDPAFTGTAGSDPAAVGNRVAWRVIAHGINDNSNELKSYANRHYTPTNPALVVVLPGNPTMLHPTRWQPLALDYFVDQAGQIVPGGYPEFLSPEWGQVKSFSLASQDRTIYTRDNFDYWVFHDPGAPPSFEDDLAAYRESFEMVLVWSGHLDPSDGVMIDASPNTIGNLAVPSAPNDWLSAYDYMDGGDASAGYDANPVTGEPYPVQMVPRGDYARVLAEFWADGPQSETPPGHWFVLLNDVIDSPGFSRRMGGRGDVLDQLEYDVKAYLLLGGAMHDTAITAWGIKGWYDYVRPVSAIRLMCQAGQCTDPAQPSYHPAGLNLHAGVVEVVTAATTASGQRHEHLRGHEGKVAAKAWRGPDFIDNPAIDEAGVGWILAENWWPYQRPSFVTPPFAGFISGHSTYSRCAAELLTLMTGSRYFPGGLGEYVCQQNEYLVFEDGPSVDVRLQWASYQDASDQCSLSRIWGGIHPHVDDIPGRLIGMELAPDVWAKGQSLFNVQECVADTTGDHRVDGADVAAMLASWGSCPAGCAADVNDDLVVDGQDLSIILGSWGWCE